MNTTSTAQKSGRARARMGRKVLSVFLAAVLVLTSFSFTAFADDQGESQQPQGTESGGSTTGTAGEVSTSAQLSFVMQNASAVVNGQPANPEGLAVTKGQDLFIDLTPDAGYAVAAVSAYNAVTAATVPVYLQGTQYYIAADFVSDDLIVSVTTIEDPEGILAGAQGGVAAAGDIGTLAEDRINADWDYITTDDELGVATTTVMRYARVYTAAGLKTVLNNTAIEYIEFGDNISIRGLATAQSQLPINTAAGRTTLIINARDYVFTGTSSTGSSTTFTATTSATGLEKIVFRKFNVPNDMNIYGLMHVNNSGVKEVVFEGLKYNGPQIAYAPGSSNNYTDFVLDGSTYPVTITHQFNGGGALEEFFQSGRNVYMVGTVDYQRSGTSANPIFDNMVDVFVGLKPGTPHGTNVEVANTVVTMRNTTRAPLMNTNRDFEVGKGAKFIYSSTFSDTAFNTASVANLRVREGATFDVTTTGNVPTGSVRVSGDLIVEPGSTFKVQSNARTNTAPAVYTQGRVSFDNPAELLLYNSGASVMNFRSGSSFYYAGDQLAYWNSGFGTTMPLYLEPPVTNWLSDSGFTVSATASTNGTFTNFTSTGVVNGLSMTSGTPTPITLDANQFTWTGRNIISNARHELVDYTIEFRDKASDTIIDQSLFTSGTNTFTGQSYSNINVAVNFPKITGYIRSAGQDSYITPTLNPANNNFVIYYELGNEGVDEPGISKTATQTGPNEWEITLGVKGQNETVRPTTHLDLMLVIDISGSMSGTDTGVGGKTRLQMAKDAAISLIDNMVQNSPINGDLRVGLATYDSSARTVMPLTLIGDGSAIKSQINGLVSTGGTNIGRGVAQGDYELYENTSTFRDDSVKYMVLLGDGEGAGAAVANSNTYKNKGGKLITISMFESVPVLKDIQNAGFYECNDEQGFNDAIKAIQNTFKASALKTGVVIDPMGPNFELVTVGPDFNVATDVVLAGTPTGGSVSLVSTNPQTLKWELADETEEATMTYKVRMKDTTDPNKGFDTNDKTVLTYTNTDDPDEKDMEFTVPNVSYEQSILNVKYDGELPATYPADVTYTKSVYENGQIEFAGPEDLYPNTMQYLTYNGTRYNTWDEFAAAEGIVPGSGPNLYKVDADFAATYDLIYYYVLSTIIVDPEKLGVKVKDHEITFGDTLPAAYGFDNWPATIPEAAFDVVYSRNTNNNNVGVYDNELKAQLTVNAAYAGQYALASQPGAGKLTINPVTLKQDDLVVTGHDHVYNGVDQTVVSASSTATGEISYYDDATSTWVPATEYKAKDVGAYTVRFRIVGSGNYTGTVDGTATGNITPKDLPPIGEVLEYQGYTKVYIHQTEQVVADAKVKIPNEFKGKLYWTTDDPAVVASPNWQPTNGEVGTIEYKGLNAQSYYVWFKFVPDADSNYKNEAITPMVTGLIQPATYKGALVVQPYITPYNGSNQRVASARVVEGSNFTGNFQYSLDNGFTWVTGHEYFAKDVNDYPVKFRLTGYGNYTGVHEADVVGRITAATLPEGALVATPYDRTYTGSAQVVASAEIKTPSDFTGKIEYTTSADPYASDAVWVDSTEYKQTENGTYPVTFRMTGSGNYSSVPAIYKTVTGTIGREKIPDDPKLVFDTEGFTRIYNGSEQVVAKATAKSPYTGTFEYSIDGSAWMPGAEAKAIDAKGTDYNVHFRFTANGNYTGSVSTTDPEKGRINPLDLSTLDPKTVFTVTGHNEYYTASPLTVVSAQVTDVKYTGDFSYSTNSGISYTDGSEYKETEVASYSAKFRFTGSGNYTGSIYQDGTGSIKVPITGPVFTATFNEGLVYNRNEQVLATAKVNDFSPSPAWTGTLQYRVNGGPLQNGSLTSLNEVKATEAGDYEVEFIATGTGSYTGINQTETRTVTIAPMNVGPDPTKSFNIVTTERTYNGAPQTIAVANLLDGTTGNFTYEIVGDNGYTNSGTGNTVQAVEAGEYTVTFTLEGTGNYTGKISDSKKVKINPKTIDNNNPHFTAIGFDNLTFDNSMQTVAKATLDTNVTGDFTYTISGAKGYSSTGSGDTVKAMNADTYTITYTLTGTGNYQGTASKTVTGVIKPATLPELTALKATPYVHDFTGSQLLVARAEATQTYYTGEISYTTDTGWKANPAGATWIPGSELYGTNAGDYYVAFRLVGSGNYEGSIAYAETTGKINPFDPGGKVLIATGTTVQYNGSPQTIVTAQVAPGLSYTGDIYYTLDSGSTWILGKEYKQTNAGEYTASFKIVGTGNSTGEHYATAPGVITAAPIPDDWTKVFTATPYTRTYNEQEQVVAEAKLIGTEYEGGQFQYSTNQGTTWVDGDTYKGTNAGDYPVMFRYTASKNYQGTVTMDKDIVGKINPANIPSDWKLVFDAVGHTRTYNEAAQVIATATAKSPYVGTFEYKIDTGAWTPGHEAMATDAATYNVNYRFTASGNYTGTVETNTPVIGVINPRNINTIPATEVFTLTPYTRNYSGNPQVVADAVVKDIKYTGNFSYTTVNVILNQFTNGHQYSETNVGNYPVTFRFTASGNYEGTLDQHTTLPEIKEVKPGDVLVTTFNHGLVYNRNEQVIATVKVKDFAPLPAWTGTLTYSIEGGAQNVPCSITGLTEIKATEPGDYKITFTATGSGNYATSHETKTETVTIAKMPLPPDPKPFFRIDTTERTYTGQPQVIAEAVLINNTTGNFTYTITGDNGYSNSGTGATVSATRAGEYTITYTLTGTGFYTGSVSDTAKVKILPAIIGPGNPGFTAVGFTNLTYNNAMQNVAKATLNTGVTGDFTYTITGTKGYSDSGSGDTVQAMNADTYSITYTLTGTGDYSGTATETVTGIINPGVLPPNTALKVTPYTRTYNGSPQVVASAERAESYYTGDISYTTDTSWQADPSAVTWIPGAAYNETEKGSYPVAFRLVGSGNYAGSTSYASTTGTMLPYTPPGDVVLIATGTTVQYNGTPQTIVTAQVAPGVDFKGEISYTLDAGVTWIKGAEYKQTNAGEYTASFKIVGTGSYSGTYLANGKGVITAAPIPDDWTKVFTATPYTRTYNKQEQVVAKAELIGTEYDGGQFQYSTDGGVTWTDGDTYTGIDAGDYPVMFRYTASKNYQGTVKMDKEVVGKINPADLPPDWRPVFDAVGHTRTYNETAQVIATATPKSPYVGTFEHKIGTGSWQPGNLAMATNAATYEVHYRFTASGNYKGTVETDVPVIGKINPLNVKDLNPVDVFTLTPYTRTYNGSPQVVADAAVKDAKYTGSFSYTKVNVILNQFTAGHEYRESEVGNYPVTFRFTGSGNYEGTLDQYDSTPKIQLDPGPGKVLDTTFATGLVYNRSEQVIATAKVRDFSPNPAWTGTLTYSIEGGAQNVTCSLTDLNQVKATEPGTYKVTFTATGSGSYSTLSETVTETVVIAPDNIGPGPWDKYFKVDTFEQTYTGLPLEIAKATLINNTTGDFTYTVTGDNGYSDSGTGDSIKAIDAGEYTVVFTLTGTGFYTGKVSSDPIKVKILKKDVGDEPSFTAVGYDTLIYNQNPQTVAKATRNAGVTGNFTYEITGTKGYVNSGASDTVMATNADTYTIKYTLTGTGNYTGTASETVTGKISPYTVNPGVPGFTVQTYSPTFTGAPVNIAKATLDAGVTGDFTYVITGTKGYSNSGAGDTVQAVEADTYTITYTLTGTGNYDGTASKTVTTTINPIGGGDYLETSYDVVEYNKNAQVISTANIKPGVMYEGKIEYSIDGGKTWVESNEYKETNAAKYPITWRLTGTGSYSGVETDSGVAEITRKIIDPINPGFDATGYTNLIFKEGTSQTIADAVLTGGTTGDFTYRIIGAKGTNVTGSGDTAQAINADDYSITFTITGTGNYEGTASKTVAGKIAPKPFDPDPKLYMDAEGYSKVYNSKLQTVADADTKPGVTGTFEYSLDDGATWIPGSLYQAKDVGVYDVIFKLNGTGNYTGSVQMKVTGEITKGKIDGIPTLDVVGHIKEHTGSALTVVSAEIKAGTDFTGKIEYTTDNPLLPTAIWHESKEYKETEAGTYTATFRLTGTGNYEGYSYGTATGQITKQTLPPGPDGVIAITENNLEYNGKDQVVLEAKPVAPYTGDLSYSLDNGSTWNAGDKVMGKEVGSYTAIFKLTGTGSYTGESTKTGTGTIYKQTLPIDPGIIDAKAFTVEYTGAPLVVASAKIADGTSYTGDLYFTTDDGATWKPGNQVTGIAAKDYPVKFKLVGNGSYSGEVISNEVVGKITRKDISKEVDVLLAQGFEQTYNNTPRLVAKAAIDTGSPVTGDITYTTDSIIMPWTTWVSASEYYETNVADYPVTFRLTGTGDYTGTVDVKVTGKIKPADGSKDGYLEVYKYTETYDGTEKVVAEGKVKASAPADYTGTIEYSVDGGKTWTTGSQLKAIDAGKYPVTFRLTGTGNYTGVEELSTEGEITAQTITDPKLVFDVTGWTETYTGSPITIAKAVPVAGSGVTGDIDYTIDGGVTWVPMSEYKETDAGNYPVTFRFTATGNHKGAVTETVTGIINPADLPTDPYAVLDPYGYTKEYNGNPQVVAEVKVKPATNYTGDFTYSTDNGATWVGSGSTFEATNVGNYPVVFKFTGNQNYTGELTIKAEGNITPAGLPTDLYAVLQAQGHQRNYTGSEQIVANAWVVDASKYIGVISYTTDNPLSPGAAWNLGSQYKETEVADYEVTFRFVATGGNYTGTVYTTANGKISAKQISGNGNDYMTVRGYTTPHTGAEQIVASAAPKAGSGVTGYIESSVDGITWTNSSNYGATAVGYYPVVFRFVATGNYSGVAYLNAIGNITAAPMIPEPPINVYPPNVTVNPPSVIVNNPGGGSGGGTTIVEVPVPTATTTTTTTTTPDDDSNTGTTITTPKVPTGGTEVESEEGWSLVNLIIGAITAIFSVALLAVALLMWRRNRKAEEGDVEAAESTRYKSTAATKVLGVITGVLGVLPLVAFFILEDFTAKQMVGINENTPLIAILALVFLVMFVVYFVVRNRDNKTDRLEQQGSIGSGPADQTAATA